MAIRELFELRGILRNLARDTEVLPAVGGAVQDLDRPDFEEREDRALGEDERVYDTVFERGIGGAFPSLYRHTPPIGRAQDHLFRYFLDGSFQSYFLGTMLENERETPVHFAQVGACVIHRQADGRVEREHLDVQYVLLAGRQRLAPETWAQMEGLARAAGVRLVDLAEQDIASRVHSDFDLRNNAAGKVRWEMHKLEAEVIQMMLPKARSDQWLVVDGSLLFQPTLPNLNAVGEIAPVVGVAKNFRKDPRFVYGRGPRAQQISLFRLLADLQVEHRTAAFSSRAGNAVFWYVRLREHSYLDYPLMGVVKAELINPTREPVPAELLDRLSSALVAERSVTPHGQDQRWHAHIYPIFLAERAVKESLLTREVVQQYLKWR